MHEELDKELVALITRYQGPLFCYIKSMLPQGSDADDVLQEANVILWKKRRDFRQGSNFKAWSYSIARYQVLAFLEKKRRKGLPCFGDELLERIAETQNSTHVQEKLHYLDHCISSLSPSDHELIQVFYVRQLTLKDYSKKVKRSTGALKQALFRIRHSLKLCIKQKIGSLR